jgi:hypothetical protein
MVYVFQAWSISPYVLSVNRIPTSFFWSSSVFENFKAIACSSVSNVKNERAPSHNYRRKRSPVLCRISGQIAARRFPVQASSSSPFWDEWQRRLVVKLGTSVDVEIDRTVYDSKVNNSQGTSRGSGRRNGKKTKRRRIGILYFNIISLGL